jgi:putative hydrolase of the HAD superfamily
MSVVADLEAVLFDWGGTLTPWHTIDQIELWGEVALLVAPDRAADLGRALAEAEDVVWDRCRTEGLSGRLDEVFAACGVEASEAALARYAELWDPHTHLDPDAPDLLHALRERSLRIGVLSNTLWTREAHETVFARDGVLDLIDAAVYTSEIPWTKPHPEAFRAALDAVQVTAPERAVFVGDRLYDDIHGAQSVGMRTVYIPHSEIPHRQRGSVDGTPDAVVHRLAEVLDVVDRWRKEPR